MSDQMAQSPYVGNGGYCGLHHRSIPCPVCTSAPTVLEQPATNKVLFPSPPEWQLCPKCLGTKVQSAPPGIPPGQSFMSTSFGPWPCVICSGMGLIQRPSKDPT